jgi:hypothetical protein
MVNGDALLVMAPSQVLVVVVISRRIPVESIPLPATTFPAKNWLPVVEWILHQES